MSFILIAMKYSMVYALFVLLSGFSSLRIPLAQSTHLTTESLKTYN